MLMKKLVMFDMDGVLFDSMPKHARAWHQTLFEYGYDIPESAFFLHEGRISSSTVSILIGPGHDYKALYKRKGEILATLEHIEVMDGALDAIAAVREAGADAIVVTGSSQDMIIERLKNEFKGLLKEEWMVTGRDVKCGKPSPEPYQRGLEKAGVAPCDAIVVENAPLGVKSGHDAGCFVIAVNTGPLDDEVLLKEGADVLYHSMRECAEHLPELILM